MSINFWKLKAAVYGKSNSKEPRSAMARRSYELGKAQEATQPETLKAIVAEFLATFTFVFATEGSILALGKMYEDTHEVISTSRLVAIAGTHACSLFLAVSMSLNISGGHVNPAVTFGALVAGRISLLRASLYCLAQLFGSVVASLLLRLVIIAGPRPVGFPLAFERDWHGLIIEAAMTLGLVYTFYATTMDPRKSHLTTLAPLAMGFFAGANILTGGPSHGASMNPARAFGPALVGSRWTKHWIYWVGPLVGGGLGAITYEYMVMPSETSVPHHCIQQSCTSS